jgi:hypothetical protein
VRQKANLIRKPAGKMVKKGGAEMVRRSPGALALPAPKARPGAKRKAAVKGKKVAPKRPTPKRKPAVKGKGVPTKKKTGASKRRPARR